MEDLHIGVILGFLSAFTYALGSIFVQMLKEAIPDLQLNFYRSLGQTILSGLFLIAKRQHPIVTGKESIFYTTIVGVSGAVQNVLIFIGVLLIPVGTAGSLFHAGSIIFTLLLARMLKMEDISFRKFIIFILTLAGIFLTLFSVLLADNDNVSGGFDEQQRTKNVSDITINRTGYQFESQESTITNNDLYLTKQNKSNDLYLTKQNKSNDLYLTKQNNSFRKESQRKLSDNEDYMNNFGIDKALGVALSLGSGLAQTGLILGEKKALSSDNPVSGPVLSFWVSAAGLPISIALVPVFEKLTFVWDVGSILLVIGYAAAAGVSIILFCLALERVPGVVVSLTFISDLPIRVIAQYLVIPDLQKPGGRLFDLIGSLAVTIALCMPGFWNIMDKKMENRNNEEKRILQTEKQVMFLRFDIFQKMMINDIRQ